MSEFFASAPRGAEPLLVTELKSLGAGDVRSGRGGVAFSGELETAYRACLWSRVASRVLLTLGRFPAPTPEALYQGVRRIDWSDHLRTEGSLAVDGFVRSSKITHSRFAALKVKDAVVDQFRERTGGRPSVDPRAPDVRLNLYLFRDEARLSLDLSGEGLHRRGYRSDGGAAPLKENLAATLLLRADWPWIAQNGGALLDPMCGSGTLPIEAALIAADIAPGLLGRRFGFEHWLGHVPILWSRLLQEAEERRRVGLNKLPPIFASDRDPNAVRLARRNMEQAGLARLIRVEQRSLVDVQRPQDTPFGLLLVNPPYGERLGDEDEIPRLYHQLGDLLHQRFDGWRAGVFTGNTPLIKALRLKQDRVYELYNGALECTLFTFRVEPQALVTPRGKGGEKQPPLANTADHAGPVPPESEGARMLVNRLRKNLKHLGRWARRNGITCYRLYDADLPEYAAAVDLYHSDETWAVVQEYAAPPEVPPELAHRRLGEILGAVIEVVGVPAPRTVIKNRRRQRGNDQYEKHGRGGLLHEVDEGDCRFQVNFTDYLDTGLFLDHRITRGMVRDLAAGRDFLNLFAYTGAFSVHAAAGGARSTTTVDMSKTYLDWARRNMALNGFRGNIHEFIQADCLQWLEQASESPPRRYGLIVLDPPTFSSSKRMDRAFDVQRDHVRLIRWCADLLDEDGLLIFSNNYKKFRMDSKALPDLVVSDISETTMPEDFRRNPRIHRCWKISRRQIEDPVWPGRV